MTFRSPLARKTVNVCNSLLGAALAGGAIWLAGLGALHAAETAQVVTVPAAKATVHLAVPLPAELAAPEAGCFKLMEIDDSGAVLPGQAIPAMASDGTVAKDQRCLAASIPPRIRPGAAGPSGGSGARRFRVEPGTPQVDTPGFRFRPINDKSTELLEGDKPVFVYNHGVITGEKVPKNDARRNRACFVHPIYGLHGEVLTESFPKDHWHHHGLFWAWPHVGIDGKQYDLWVYNNIQQRFVRWLVLHSGPVAAVLAVENGWFVGDQKVMIERVWLRVYRASGGERSIDVQLVFIPVDKPITLWGAEGKSYGGINLRYAPRKNTVITVPSGRSKEDLPDTPLAWADLTAEFAGAPGPSGAALFVDPKHPDFPPTWLTRHYGILCIGWPGVKPKTFPPGKPIHMSYRMWIHKSAVELADLQDAFAAYGASAKAVWSGQ